MKVEQFKWTKEDKWQPEPPGKLNESAQLVLLFGSTSIIRDQICFDEIKKAYPAAHLFGCSTAGEIFETEVNDDSLVLTAVSFEHTAVEGTQIKLSTEINSFQAGENLVRSLTGKGLVHLFVLSDGMQINGTELVAGLTKNLPPGVTVTGGLSGDGPNFEETYAFWDGVPEKGVIAAMGLYGDRLKVGYGSLGGWDTFGPERLITRSKGNVLYELDGKSALELYKKYLGEHARDLPASGLLFPLSLRAKEGETAVVRTILSVSETEQSMTFAGDVPEGAYARLMKANFDRLIDGAVGAATTSYEAIDRTTPDLAILISCIGRKMVLRQRIEEEVEGASDVLGEKAKLTGFYSYGEISPFTPNAKCELHNQTMTITTVTAR